MFASLWREPKLAILEYAQKRGPLGLGLTMLGPDVIVEHASGSGFSCITNQWTEEPVEVWLMESANVEWLTAVTDLARFRMGKSEARRAEYDRLIKSLSDTADFLKTGPPGGPRTHKLLRRFTRHNGPAHVYTDRLLGTSFSRFQTGGEGQAIARSILTWQSMKS